MSTSKKARIQTSIFTVLTMAGFMACGGLAGYGIGMYEKSKGADANGLEFAMLVAGSLVSIYLLYMIQMYCHEIGHMIFGLLTGYKFASIRFGSLIFVKMNGKLKVKRHKVAGTGGQAIMLPPEGELGEHPFFWYHMGGLTMNLILSVVALVGWLLVPESYWIIRFLLLTFAVLGLIVLITNGLPFTELGTDGANTILLSRDKEARAIVDRSFLIIGALADGKAIEDMSEEYFLYDKSTPLDNPLASAQAVNRVNYLIVKHRFEEALDLTDHILANATSINRLHSLILISGKIYMLLVERKDVAGAQHLQATYEKQLKQVASLIDVQRQQYAYNLLALQDETKAETSRQTFEKLAKNYPYPKDAESERKLMMLARERYEARRNQREPGQE